MVGLQVNADLLDPLGAGAGLRHLARRSLPQAGRADPDEEVPVRRSEGPIAVETQPPGRSSAWAGPGERDDAQRHHGREDAHRQQALPQC